MAPEPDEPRSDAITLTRAAQILWAFRDDCHIPAWQAKGGTVELHVYEGGHLFFVQDPQALPDAFAFLGR